MSGWRKLAPAIWKSPRDPQIYGELELGAEPLLAYIDEIRATTGVRVTVTHLVGRAVAHALAEHPSLNVALARGRFLPRDSVDVFFVVAVDGGRDLSGVKVRSADRKSAVEVAEELATRAARIRTGEDAAFGRTKGIIEATPRRLLGPALRAADLLTGALRLDLRRSGFPRDPFGSAMVTSVGMFGVQRAYAPLSPYYRIPFLVLVSEVTEKPVAVDGQVVAAPVLTLSVTMDHRYLDGGHAAALARSVRAYLSAPASYEPDPGVRPRTVPA